MRKEPCNCHHHQTIWALETFGESQVEGLSFSHPRQGRNPDMQASNRGWQRPKFGEKEYEYQRLRQQILVKRIRDSEKSVVLLSSYEIK